MTPFEQLETDIRAYEKTEADISENTDALAHCCPKPDCKGECLYPEEPQPFAGRCAQCNRTIYRALVNVVGRGEEVRAFDKTQPGMGNHELRYVPLSFGLGKWVARMRKWDNYRPHECIRTEEWTPRQKALIEAPAGPVPSVDPRVIWGEVLDVPDEGWVA
jgi:hypothetical protein